jgi:hypothetical protein
LSLIAWMTRYGLRRHFGPSCSAKSSTAEAAGFKRSANLERKAVRIDRLIEAGAWIEAALALVELERPTWKLQRLVYDNGEWLCSLSRQRNLPIGLDDSAEAALAVLPLAVLRALVEARRRSGTAPETIAAVPKVRPTSAGWICCDNFA